MTSSFGVPVIAAILGGGLGTRMSLGEPKQLVELAGQPMLAHSLRAFETHPEVDGIVLVIHRDLMARARTIAREAEISKLSAVVAGGATRSDSSVAALGAAPSDALILIHDAARPLVDHAIISAVLEALSDAKAAAPVLAVSDTIVETSHGAVSAVPDREKLRRVQTPQGFHQAALREAYRLSADDPHFVATDDCGVLHRYLPQIEIKLVEGSVRNIKVTHDEDLVLAEQLLAGA